MERIGRLWRMLKIYAMVQGKPGIGAAELAQRCEVSLRTVYRDVSQLKLAGIPIYSDRGYRLSGDFFLPPVQLDLNEALSLAVGAEVLSRQKGTLLEKGILGAMEKIYAALPPAVRDNASREAARYRPVWEPTVDYEGRAQVLEALERGLEENRTVMISYRSVSRKESTLREVDPYGFLFRSSAWYLVGHCHLRGEIRIFKVDRILKAETLDRVFTPPEDFDLGRYMGDAWQVMRGEAQEVKVLFSPQSAPYAKECIWHPSQRCSDREDGSAVLSFKVGGLGEICSWVMSFGGEVEVLEPPGLREMVRERARGILRLYGEAP